MRGHPSRKPGRAMQLPLAVILAPRARPRHNGFVVHAWLHRAGCRAVRTARSWRGIVAFTHLAREGRMKLGACGRHIRGGGPLPMRRSSSAWRTCVRVTALRTQQQCAFSSYHCDSRAFVTEEPTSRGRQEDQMPEIDLSDLAAKADCLADDIRGRGINAAYPAFDVALAQFESAGYQVSDILPEAASQRLGLARKNAPRPDGRTFWEHYAEVVCAELCGNKARLNNLVKNAANGAGASLVTSILTSLSLPAGGALIAATIAGVIMALGVDAFCKYRGYQVSTKP